MIPLNGKRIKLRAVEPSDLDILYAWENDPANWLLSNTLTPFSRHILQKYIESAQMDIYEAKQLRLMIDLPGTGDGDPEAIGTIDLFDFDSHNQRAGIGILIAKEDNRMKGYATEALSVLIDYAFGILNLHQLYCNISEKNKASLKLFKKLGFIESGRKTDWLISEKNWIDVILLQKINPQDA